MGQILGITKGNTGNFVAVPAPPGSALQAGSVPSWVADDSNVSLSPSADGLSVAVLTSASDPATSFNLTLNGVNSDGAAISTTVSVPLAEAPPPPPPAAQGFDITQTS